MHVNTLMALLLTFLLLRLSENNTFDAETKEIAKLIEEGRNQCHRTKAESPSVVSVGNL
jgi:hypothetical protein